jgi:hypothetical protein
MEIAYLALHIAVPCLLLLSLYWGVIGPVSRDPPAR